MTTNNSYTFNLTGTSFGKLDTFKRSTYIHGYEFVDINGDEVTYTNVLSGGPLIPFNITNNNSFYSEIAEPILWLDANETSNLQIGNGGIVNSIRDKTSNNHLFTKQVTFVEGTTANWFGEPIDSTNFWAVSNFESDFKKCFRIGANSYFECDTFLLNYLSSFYCYFVWKENLNEFSFIRKTVPFAFAMQMSVPTLSSEYLFEIDYDSVDKRLLYGVRDDIIATEVIKSLTAISYRDFIFTSPTITKFSYNGTYLDSLSTQSMSINGVTLTADRYYLGGNSLNSPLIKSNIGYYSDTDIYNNFYFCELLVFNNKLTDLQEKNLTNYLVKKWNLDITLQQQTYSASKSFSTELFSNITYQDVNFLTSNFTIPSQSCTTNLTILLSGFDESVSKVLKIYYEYNGVIKYINIPISSNANSSFLTGYKIDVVLEPDQFTHSSNFSVNLSVVRYDTSINKIKISGVLLKCGVLDFGFNNYLIDTQITSDINKGILVLENKDKNQIYLNYIDISKSPPILSGGDVVVLKNDELKIEEEEIILLDELLAEQEEEIAKEIYKVPPTLPISESNINPVKPLPY
jgi:Tfp pilus assembly protein PilZ